MKTIKVSDLPCWAQEYLYQEEFKFDKDPWSLREMAEYIIERSNWSGDEIDDLYLNGQLIMNYIKSYEDVTPKDRFKFDWSEE